MEETYIFTNKKRIKRYYVSLLLLLPIFIYGLVYISIEMVFLSLVYILCLFIFHFKLYSNDPEIIITEEGIAFHRFYIFKEVIYWENIVSIIGEENQQIMIIIKGAEYNSNILKKIRMLINEDNIIFSTYWLDSINNRDLNELISSGYRNYLMINKVKNGN